MCQLVMCVTGLLSHLPHYASGAIDKCPGGTSSSDPRSSMLANPEAEGCCGVPDEEMRDVKKATQEAREERRNNNCLEVGESLEAAGNERTTESGEESGRPKGLGKRSSQPKTRRLPRTPKSPDTSQEGRG
ncbi:hypothetical protein NDU88_005213 [Pleurodeles waltl]|uniref:Uncharacterized protein n=1 Tax=Pleurodeles waltl TaxID=8319 RepID=A0AAV7UHE5_PLEWA|nr:hypothetical protein NDU88_005213 [Pleurodeles waltl]